jgi:hypothetical protein
MTLKEKRVKALHHIRDVFGGEEPVADKLEVVRNLIVTCEGMEELLEEMKSRQEPKYKIRGQIINRESGSPIPDDEPIFILRARDVAAVRTLESYRSEAEAAGSPPDHLQAVQLRVEQFRKFSSEHPDRMKKPDTVLTEEWANL